MGRQRAMARFRATPRPKEIAAALWNRFQACLPRNRRSRSSSRLPHAIVAVWFGPFPLGGVCGTLIAALTIGQSGARLDNDVKNVALDRGRNAHY
jgi:hypothetical protein